MGKLDDKTVLVSGGARGIGAAIARAVVGEGGRVVIGDVLDDDGAQIVTELGEERARFVQLDVTDGAQWRDAVATAESTFGPVSVLVNNAGIVRWGTVADLDPAVWQEVLGVNLTGVFLHRRRSRRCDAPAVVARWSTSHHDHLAFVRTIRLMDISLTRGYLREIPVDQFAR
ncbi:MAG TPA: SDR family NAD(P)-dependent oxidoreductase, partial [Propionibacteriaceae bacterium]|nr:SDR family NAD(P)-dependent oxidoreductase [Propionibacteriaceae bacterium]